MPKMMAVTTAMIAVFIFFATSPITDGCQWRDSCPYGAKRSQQEA